MRLAEAIFLGSKLRPQIFGAIRDAKGTCALGAAEDALGIDNLAALENTFAWSLERGDECPVCAACGMVLSMIPHLNDAHFWTREQIAAWVASADPTPREIPEQPDLQTFLEVVNTKGVNL